MIVVTLLVALSVPIATVPVGAGTSGGGSAAAGPDDAATGANASTAGGTLVVDDDGAECPGAGYGSVQAAVNESTPGDTVAVCAGTYRENVTVTTPAVRLRAANDTGVVLDGGRSLDAGVDVRADRVEVDGFTVRNYTEAGVRVAAHRPVGDVTVSNNTVSGIYQEGFFRLNPGVHLEDTTDARVVDNRLRGSGSGLWMFGSADATVARNEVRGNSFAGLLVVSDVQQYRAETRRLERRLNESSVPGPAAARGEAHAGPERRADRGDAAATDDRFERDDAAASDDRFEGDDGATRPAHDAAGGVSPGVVAAMNATRPSSAVNGSLTNRRSLLAVPDNRTLRASERAGITSSNNTFRDNTVVAGDAVFGLSVVVAGGVDDVVANNTVSDGYAGLVVADESDPVVRDNRVTGGSLGLLLVSSDRARLRDNAMANNEYNLDVTGSYNHGIDRSNTVDGQPVLYVDGVEDYTLEGPTEFGYVGIVNAANVTVRNVTLTNQGNGLLLSNVDGGVVENVTLTDNYEGVRMQATDDLEVRGITARNNVVGLYSRDARGVEVADNRLTDNGVGVVSLYGDNAGQTSERASTGLTVTRNNVSANGYGTVHVAFGPATAAADRLVDNDLRQNRFGGVLYLLGSSIEIADNRLSGGGITLFGAPQEAEAAVTNNSVRDSRYGVVSYGSEARVRIENNRVSETGTGIALIGSTDHLLRGNAMHGNRVGLQVRWGYNHDVDRSNTVDGKPVYYLRNEAGRTVGAGDDPGYLAVVDSTDVTVRNLTLTDIGGVPVVGSTDVTVRNVQLLGTADGIRLLNTRDSSVRDSRFVGDGAFGDGITVATCGYCVSRPTTPVESAGNEVVGNDVSGFYEGIEVVGSADDTVANNTLVDNGVGLEATGADRTTLRDNELRDNGFVGISLYASRGAVLRGNEMRGNGAGLDVRRGYKHDVDRSNTVGGKPVYYLRNEAGRTVDAGDDPGYLAVVDSTDVTVRNLTLTGVGLPVVGSTGVTVENVTLQDARSGIDLVNARDSRVVDSALSAAGFSRGITVRTCASCVPGTSTPADSARNEIAGNDVSGFYQGIELRETTADDVSNNTLVGNHGALEVDDTVRTTVRGNDVRDNLVGIEVDCCRTTGQDGPVATLEGNRIAANRVGVVLDASEGRVDVRRNAIVDNRRSGILVDRPFFPSSADSPQYEIHRNHIAGNGEYGVRNEREDVVVNAIENYWGAGSGPSSPDATSPLADPRTGALADGAGDAVSEGEEPGVSNVRFDPFLTSPPSDAGREGGTA